MDSTSRTAPRALSPARAPRLGLTAVIPCFNEGDGIARAYDELAAELAGYDAEILFVDDGSDDGTLERIKSLAATDARVRYISFTRNFGLEAAFGAGFRYAGKPWILQIDADLQSPPRELHRLLARAVEGGYDVVFGIRRDRKDPWARRVASRVQHWIARRLLGIEVPAGASTFRVIRASVAKKISGLRLGTPYFLGSVPMVGARYTTLETEHAPRRNGRTRFRLGRLITHALDLFFGFSLRPFVLLSAFAALAGLITVVVAAAGGTATPALLATQTLSLAGLALLGRYVMRLVRQAHPVRYLVRESNLDIAPQDLLYEREAVVVPAVLRSAA
jgi:polyisoprenyl-phosphate glycosyltransferase